MPNEGYAKAGVDSSKIQVFKELMTDCGKRTLTFCHRRDIEILRIRQAHGAAFRYTGKQQPIFIQTTESLGNKVWIAQWMYQNSGTGLTYHKDIPDDTMMMAVNDALAHGGMPFMYTDEVATGTSDWFTDRKRGAAMAEGYYRVCQREGIALPAGESPSLRYLIKAEAPVTDAPVLSGTVTSIVSVPDRLITGENLRPGLKIIGAPSSGIHSNGISLVIEKALQLPDKFMTKLDTGRTLGEEALLPTRSYVLLIEALQDAGVKIAALLPGTGDGVSKLAVDKRPIQYHIHTWLPEEKIPFLFRFLRDFCGVSPLTCLKTFNWGIGYYIFVEASDVQLTIDTGAAVGHELIELGETEEGPRQTILKPYNGLILPPPGM